MNEALASLATILPDAALRARVLETLGWAGRRPIAIVELRPEADLPGDLFEGFFERKLRETYVAKGEEAARAWLASAARAPQNE
jgi:hypothetical protein